MTRIRIEILKNVRYIINTHPHGDHAGGNEACGKNATLLNFRKISEDLLKFLPPL